MSFENDEVQPALPAARDLHRSPLARQLRLFLAANDRLMASCDLHSLGCLYFVSRDARRLAWQHISDRIKRKRAEERARQGRSYHRPNEFDFPFGSCAQGIDLLYPSLSMKPTYRFGGRIVGSLIETHGEISFDAIQHLVHGCGMNWDNSTSLPRAFVNRNASTKMTDAQRLRIAAWLILDRGWGSRSMDWLVQLEDLAWRAGDAEMAARVRDMLPSRRRVNRD